jgi:hypothetical protein
MSDTRISDFIWNCRRVVEEQGSAEHRQEIGVAAIGWQLNPNGALAYKDDVVTIVCEAAPSPALLVIRVENHNPVLCVDKKGEPFRQHGEIVHLEEHVARLCRVALAKRLMTKGHGGRTIINMDRLVALENLADRVQDFLKEIGDRRLEAALDDVDKTPLSE